MLVAIRSRSEASVDIATEQQDEFDNKNIILSHTTLISTLRAVHECCRKNQKALTLMEVLEKRQGQYCCLQVKCSVCNLKIHVDENPDCADNCFREHKLDNRRMAFAADCVGLNFEQLS